MIEYESVTKIFGAGKDAVTAVDRVSLQVQQGEVVVLLGPSGCGKTTLLRLTNRLETLTGGAILVQGQDIMSLDKVKLRLSMGYVIQQIGLFPNKTIAANIGIVPRMFGWDKVRIQKRVDELLELVNMNPVVYRSRYPAELSGGQQQRVGLARALAADPHILLMDEPFGAVDPINRQQIQDEFMKLQAQLKKTVLFVSHDIYEAIKMGDRIAMLQKGKLVQYDTPERILTRPRDDFVAKFMGTDRTLKLIGLLQVKDAMDSKPRNAIEASMPVTDALKLIKELEPPYGVVVQNGRPLGYVTPDILSYKDGVVLDVMKPLPEIIEEYQSLRDVLSSMFTHNVPILSVVDDNGNLIGTIDYHSIQKRILDIYSDKAENT
jgi:osmoprotectant transport system ATP-binding protein